MNKKVVLALTCALVCLGTTGCSSKELSELRNMGAVMGESNVAGVNMTAEDKAAAVYAQVSNRTLLDLSKLEKMPDADRVSIINYMEKVNNQLIGTIKADSGVIDQCYTDYLLMLFERSPYYWQRSSMNIKGIDPASRSVVVDVTYKTLGYKKAVIGASNIPMGCNEYDKKVEVRYNRYMSILDYKYNTLNWSGSGYEKGSYKIGADGVPSFIDKSSAEYKKYLDMVNEFKSAYGDPDDIIETQTNESLSDYVYRTGNQKTYSGLVSSSDNDSSGSMTVRFVLEPSIVMGLNQGYSCQHAYMIDYKADKDPSEGLTEATDINDTITKNVNDTLYSYFNSVDEDDFEGLYKLIKGFEDYDKYYEDYFDTSYRKHENFTFSIYNVTGTTVDCGVTVSEKERAKGSNMSMPIYTSKYYFTFELVDDALQITNIVPISTELNGEPSINTTKVDTTGFSSSVTLANTDKQSIEKQISELGVVQLSGKFTSDKFSEIVDTSLSENQLNSLKTNIGKISGSQKAVWINSYLQGANNYARVSCNEIVLCKDNKLREYGTEYSLVNKGGKWVITGYDIVSAVELNSTEMLTTNALCVCSAEKVESLTSQVTAGDSEQKENKGQDDVVTFEVTEPKPKSEVKSQKVEAKDITDSDLIELLNDSAYLATLNKVAGTTAKDGSEALTALRGSEHKEVLEKDFKEIAALEINYKNGVVKRETYVSGVAKYETDMHKVVAKAKNKKSEEGKSE